MTRTVVNDAALTPLRSRFAGDLITPESNGYDDARSVFNAMIDRRPAVVAQCETPQDVAAAIGYAREQDLEIAVRGGGHSVAGMAVTEGGLVVDLRRMHAASVDPYSRTVRVGGGATMSHLDRATQPYDLVTTGGRVSTTGVGGFTLSGGSGWLERKFGLACDNLESVRLVTADGREVTANENENPDLFWALHGGGGNFGVATELTFRLHPLPSFTAAVLLWPAEAGPEILRRYRDFMASAPDEVGGGFIYMTAAPDPFVPDSLVGRLVCSVVITYTGPEGDLRDVAEPMLNLGHEGAMIAALPYAEFQCMLDDPPGLRNYWSAEYLSSLPDEAVDLFCARAGEMLTPSASQHVLFPVGGAVARGPADRPIAWRGAPWAVHPFGLWEEKADDAHGRQWARDVIADMQPWAIGAVLLNFIGNEGQDRVRAGVGEDNYLRLAAVKRHYDPDNVFHRNHNIEPG